jgi:hypothetical protein
LGCRVGRGLYCVEDGCQKKRAAQHPDRVAWISGFGLISGCHERSKTFAIGLVSQLSVIPTLVERIKE